MSGDRVVFYREKLKSLREVLFANIVMAAELPAPTGKEERLTDFLCHRFTEYGLDNISLDEAGNAAGVLSGESMERNILVAAHADKVWKDSEDHTVTVGAGEMSGRGIADNSLGVAALATLPLALELLGITLKSNLILLGTTRSFGRGNLEGIRFFLNNTEREINSALCVEGMQLGRLSFASLGMARGKITIEIPDGCVSGMCGVVDALTQVGSRLVEMAGESADESELLIGSIEAVSGYNVPPVSGCIRFEIRSSEAAKVSEIEKQIFDLVAGFQTSVTLRADLEMFAHRRPGKLESGHPVVTEAREVLGALGIEPRETPSISELAPLLNHRIPALTLGVTRGEHRHLANESIELAPVFDGLAQLVAMIEFMDSHDLSFD
ncbi:M20/M25/M40 family metallo-hydrolase [Verrucomicrobiales bacterium BCK34]|nr:M20/M25/M40 family metallo-hydrolase [Verrucomicrobiales bacterium BCK34]